jgi:hypothetical protein
MSYKIREYNSPTDREVLKTMFVRHGLPEHTVDFASTTGFVLYDSTSGIIRGASFLYMTNSPISMIDLFVIDPDVPKPERTIVIDLLIEVMIYTALVNGFGSILAEPRFVRSFSRLEKHGFKELKPGTFILEF